MQTACKDVGQPVAKVELLLHIVPPRRSRWLGSVLVSLGPKCPDSVTRVPLRGTAEAMSVTPDPEAVRTQRKVAEVDPCRAPSPLDDDKQKAGSAL